MKNRDQILIEIFNSKSLSSYIRKVAGKRLAEDLKSEFHIKICSKDENVILKNYASDYFYKYLTMIIINVWRSNAFKKKYKSTNIINIMTEIDDEEIIIPECEQIEDKSLDDYYLLEDIIDKLPQLDKDVVNLYTDNKSSLPKVSKKTGVPRVYLTQSLNKSRQFIKKNYKP